jgi:hypothetical protein
VSEMSGLMCLKMLNVYRILPFLLGYHVMIYHRHSCPKVSGVYFFCESQSLTESFEMF